jgi:hypothetical protein
MNTKNRIIVAFHVGRGGQFFNPGHRTYIGEKTFQDIIRLNERILYYHEAEEEDSFETGYYDCSGNLLIPQWESARPIGRLEIDGQYNTDYCKYIEDCTEEELILIQKDTSYKSYELETYINTYFKDETN